MARARTTRRGCSNGTPGAPLKPKLIALSVAAAFAFSVEQAAANPTGPAVVSGSATFATQGNALNITNSANAIINWQGFSINANEITRFIQPSQLSAVLNRVVGAGGTIPQSVINGVLTSNGHVYLLNPSGIIIGAGARIDVAGLVASSLDLSNEDFLAGKLKFSEVPGAGAVQNQGTIDTGPGGRVYLVGSSVENSGIIRSPEGDVVLAAGKTVELVSESAPYVSVRITADSEQAKNLGTIIADSGRIGIHGAIVTQGGVAEASGAVVGPGGEIRLVASKDVNVEAGSRTAANGTEGGNVVIQAETGTAKIAGAVEVTGSSGNGGTVQALGVRVGVLGNGIIDASGETGGGTVLVGGDYQGKNADVQNSQQTYIGSDGVIRADARDTGNGGRVIAWSDGGTQFYGSISARGGANGGDGGFVETSGKQNLQAFGRVDVSAPKGKGGNWLLDPYTINIIDGTAGTGDLDYGGIASYSGTVNYYEFGSSVSVGAIQSAISGGNVTLQAQADSVGNYGDVNFNFSAATLDLTTVNPSNNGFNILAAGNIDLKNRNVTNNGSLSFQANYGGFPNGATGSGAILNGGNLTSMYGSVFLRGQGATVGNVSGATGVDVFVPGALNMGTVDSSGGSVVLDADGSLSASTISANGNVSLFSNDISTGGIASTGGYVDVNGLGSVTVGNVSAGGSTYGAMYGWTSIYLRSPYGSLSAGQLTNTGLTGGRAIVAEGNGNVFTLGITSLGGNVFVKSAAGTTTVSGSVDTRSYGVCCGISGDVYVSGQGNVTVNGNIFTRSTENTVLDGDPIAGDVFVASYGGSVQITGNIDTSASDGGFFDPYSNWAGDVFLDGKTGVSAGNIKALGAAGTNVGYGGWGGDVGITSDGAVQVGDIDARGGDAVGSPYGAGFMGGVGGAVTIEGMTGANAASINAGAIDVSGGNGSAGSGGPGGAGGYAGLVMLSSNATNFASVTGNGGTGGAGTVGGDGGPGAYVAVYNAPNPGPITAVGGNAGAGGVAYGGSGGLVMLDASGAVALNSITARAGLNGDGSQGPSGLFYLYSNGGVSQSGALNVDSMYVDTQGAAGDVVLANSANFVPIFTGGASPVNGAFTLVTGGIANPTASVAASGNVTLKNVTPSGTYIVNASSSGGSVSVGADSVFVSSVSSPIYFEWYSPNSAPLGVSQALFSGVSAPMVKIGNSMYSSPITLSGAINVPGTLSLITNGALITQSGGGLAAGALNADGGDVLLTDPGNQVGVLQGRATNSDFQFTSAGNIMLGTADPGNATPGVTSPGYVTLSSISGSILNGVSGGYDVSAPVVQLSAYNSIGMPGAPLQARATQLDASAGTGIDLVTNQYNPQMAYVTTLENLYSGNISLTAYGGASVQNEAVNYGGDVTIQTASPLEVLSGIDAFGNILLVTAGASANDMYLDYTFVYDPNFEVIVGPGGVLTLGPNFQGPITQLTVTPAPGSGGSGSATGGELLSQLSQTAGEINNSVNFDSDTGVVGGDDDDKKERKLPSCKG